MARVNGAVKSDTNGRILPRDGGFHEKRRVLPVAFRARTGLPAPQKFPHTEKSAQRNTEQVITQGENTNLSNYQSINLDGMDGMDTRSRYEELIRDNLELDILAQSSRLDMDRINEMVEIMLDVVCSTKPTIRINGEDMPQQVVKSRFLKLNSSHIEYILDAMRDCPSDIRNIRAYMLTVLYNASLTIDNYYSALVNRDMYGGRK